MEIFDTINHLTGNCPKRTALPGLKLKIEAFFTLICEYDKN
jgi:hypothetical protein